MCLSRSLNKGNLNEIIIVPIRIETIDILGVIAHEVVHAIDDCKNGHGKAFQDISYNMRLTDCKRVNLTDFRETIRLYESFGDQLGRFPHPGYAF